MEEVETQEEFTPLSVPNEATICPECGGNKRKSSAMCSKCKREIEVRTRESRIRAPRAPRPTMREMYLEQPHMDVPGEDGEPVTFDTVVGAVQQKTAEGGKKITGWDEDDLDLIVYLLTTGVFIGIGWATMNAVDDRDFAPKHSECQAFCYPLARIVARRVKVPGMKSGDFKDVLGILSAAAAYGLRCYNTSQMKFEERKERERSGSIPVNQQVAERLAVPLTTAHNPNTVPAPNGTAPVVTGRAAIPPQMRKTLEEEGRI